MGDSANLSRAGDAGSAVLKLIEALDTFNETKEEDEKVAMSSAGDQKNPRMIVS